MKKNCIIAFILCTTFIYSNSFSQNKHKIDKSKFKAISDSLCGVWVSSIYYNALMKSHSPHKEMNLIDFVFVLENSKDTLSLSNTDGHSGLGDLRFNPPYNLTSGYYKFSWEFETEYIKSGEMQGRKILNETKDPAKSKGIPYYFVDAKFSKESSMKNDEIGWFVNEATIAGKYKIIDSTGKILSEEAIFSPDGTISGLNNFGSYRVRYDFTASFADFDIFDSDIGYNGQLGMKRTSKGYELYNLEFILPPKGPEYKMTSMKYKLVRK